MYIMVVLFVYIYVCVSVFLLQQSSLGDSPNKIIIAIPSIANAIPPSLGDMLILLLQYLVLQYQV